MKIVSGNSNRPLAEEIAKRLGVKLSDSNICTFADGELQIELSDDLLDEDCIVVQSIASSPKNTMNDNFMELLLIMDAMRRIPVGSITVVVPYYGYARQDRRVHPQSPISSKVVADMISIMGADYVLTMDIHNEALLGFFDAPIKNAYALPVLLDDIKETFENPEDVVIVSPDFGALKKAQFAAGLLGSSYAVVDKKRPKPGESMVMNVIGEFKGKDCILLDDMIDSAGTLCNAATALMERGAKSVRAYASHGIFSGKAGERIDASALKEVVVTDSIYPKSGISDKIRYVSAAEPLVAAITERFGKR
jgi:ribose-phosphate pyrophosphokinase